MGLPSTLITFSLQFFYTWLNKKWRRASASILCSCQLLQPPAPEALSSCSHQLLDSSAPIAASSCIQSSCHCPLPKLTAFTIPKIVGQNKPLCLHCFIFVIYHNAEKNDQQVFSSKFKVFYIAN